MRTPFNVAVNVFSMLKVTSRDIQGFASNILCPEGFQGQQAIILGWAQQVISVCVCVCVCVRVCGVCLK